MLSPVILVITIAAADSRDRNNLSKLAPNLHTDLRWLRMYIVLRCCIASHDPKKPGGTAPVAQLTSQMRVYSRADLCAVCRSLRIGRSRASWSPAVHKHISLSRKRKRTPACHSEASEADDSTGDSQPSTERQPTNASEQDTPASSTDPKTADWREFRCAIA